MSVCGPPRLRPHRRSHRRSHRPELRHLEGQQALEADGAARIAGVTDGVDLVEAPALASGAGVGSGRRPGW